MAEQGYQRLGALRDIKSFLEYCDKVGVKFPFDHDVVQGADSPLLQPITVGDITIGNRIAIHPMEGWDGTPDGQATEPMFRRWRRFGASGAKLIWGGEAVAVRHDGRANPNQLVASEKSLPGIAKLREGLAEEHKNVTGSTDGLLVGLQLTHSGRYCVPNVKGQKEPLVAYRHPILDARVGITDDSRVLSDGDIRALIERYHAAAKIADQAGYDFVDVKHCHGYLGHEFLSAFTRPGPYGGSFENRTRFLREIVQGIRSVAPRLKIGVRLSSFDMPPFRPDPALSKPGKLGPGIPEPYEHLLPYKYGFGLNQNNPLEQDLTETKQFIALLREQGIHLVNVTAGSPYYNPHIQRPAFYPPSDGYTPPEDPLVGVLRQMKVVRELKQAFPDMLFLGSAYSYLQDFLPNVAQAALKEGWVDSIGLGRMVLSYPQALWDPAKGNAFQTKKICRTFSDCTTAPRNGLPSGCYPLDDYYKDSPEFVQLKAIKAGKKA